MMKYAVIAVLAVGVLMFSSLNVIKAEPNDDTKLSSDRLNPIWNRTWGGNKYNSLDSIANDDSYIYATGYSSDNGGNEKSLLLKYNKNGDNVYSRLFEKINSSTWSISTNSIALDDGYVYLAGWIWSINPPNCNCIILKYDKDGNYCWNRTWGGLSFDSAYALAVDGSGLYLAGETIMANHSNTLIIKYGKDGNELWNRTWIYYNNDTYVHDIINNGSDIYLCGETSGINSDIRCFTLKYDINGNYKWNKTYGIKNQEVGKSVKVDNSGLYIAGSTMSCGDNRTFILKYDFDGSLLWNRTWGWNDNGSSDPEYMTLDYQSNSYICGAVGNSIFITKFDANGIYLWNKTWKANLVCANSITTDGSYLYIAGFYNNDALLLKTDVDGGNGSVPDLTSFIIPAVFIVAVFAVIVAYTRNKK